MSEINWNDPEAVFTAACSEYDITEDEAKTMTEDEKQEACSLLSLQCGPANDAYGYDPVAYYNSVEFADDNPYGHHLMYDVL